MPTPSADDVESDLDENGSQGAELESDALDEGWAEVSIVIFDESLRHNSVSWTDVCSAYIGWTDPDPEASDEFIGANERYYEELSEVFYQRAGGPEETYFEDAIHSYLVKTSKGELHLVLNTDLIKVADEHQDAFVRANGLITRAMRLDTKAHLLMGTRGPDSLGVLGEFGRRRLESGRSVRATITAELFGIVAQAMAILATMSRGESRPFIAIVDDIEDQLRETEEMYRRAVRRRSALYYLLGMLVALPLVPILTEWVALQFSNVDSDYRLIRITMLMGTIGAFVSVTVRLTRGRLAFRNDAVWWEISLLGGLRVLLGLVFGFVIYVLVGADLIPLAIPTSETEMFWFFGALGFLSGFSETLVPDQLVTATSRITMEKERSQDSPDPS